MSEPKPQYKHGGKRRGAGRPSLESTGEKATELTIRLDRSQYTYVKLAAERDGITIAAYLRRLIKQDVSRNQPITALTAEQTEYLRKRYKGVIKGITELINKDDGQPY